MLGHRSGRSPLVWCFSIVALVGLTLSACGSSAKSSSPSGSSGATGASSNGSANKSPYLVGLVWPATGAAADTYVGVLSAFQARIDMQNAAGGVNGHLLRVASADDQTSPQGNMTATDDLMAKNPLVLAQVSPITFVSAKIMHDAGMPVVGPGVDGTEWGQQPYTNMFSTSPIAPTMPTYAVSTQGWNGATSLAVFGYAISPSSTAAAKNFAKAADQAGLTVNYLNTSLPFGTVNVTAIVLAMKAKKINGMYLPLDISTNLALITGARQAGLNMKAVVSATGYGQTLLDQPDAVQAAQGVIFGTAGVPVELKTPATLSFQQALATYAHFTGIPGYNYYTGWEVADLAVKAIEAGGTNPTHQTIITNLRKVTNYTAGGLLPTPVNFPDFGQPANPECGYSTILQGKNFVVTNNGKPTCTNILP
jgi:branched-chain amino acid transport system substrate-binding protein